MAAPSVNKVSAAGRDGFEVSGVRLESFDVAVECHVLPGWPLPLNEGVRKAGDMKRAVAAALYRREKRPLIFDDDPALHCMAIVTGVSDTERIGYVDYFTVTFTCDPVFYSNAETVRDLAAGENETLVRGTVPALATFELTASSSTVTVTHGDGRFVKVGCSSGSKVVIDMDAKRATVNGSDARVSIESTFFEIGPGPATVRIAGGSGSMTYREGWL